jgi:hypothetical protein
MIDELRREVARVEQLLSDYIRLEASGAPVAEQMSAIQRSLDYARSAKRSDVPHLIENALKDLRGWKSQPSAQTPASVGLVADLTEALREIANIVDHPAATAAGRRGEAGRLERALGKIGLATSAEAIVSLPTGPETVRIAREMGERLFAAGGGNPDQKGFEALAQALDDVVSRGAARSRASFDLFDRAWQGIGRAPGEAGWSPRHAFRASGR